MTDVSITPEYTVVVCGHGGSAQAAAALCAIQYRTFAVSLVSSSQGSAKKWKDMLGEDNMELKFSNGRIVHSRPDLITDDPEVFKEADLVLILEQPHLHVKYFAKFSALLKESAIVVAMPARSGTDLVFASVVGERSTDMTFVAFDTLPWIRAEGQWGRKCVIVGSRSELLVAITPPAKTQKTLGVLHGLLGIFPSLKVTSHLAISLRNQSMAMHPALMYGRWSPESSWDGKPLSEQPLLYKGVDDFTETILLEIGNEIKATCTKLKTLCVEVKLEEVMPLKQWLLEQYGVQIAHQETLKSCINSFPGYSEVKLPCKVVPFSTTAKGWLPDFTCRYLSEDVPTGLCYAKGVAELLGVPTPTMDKVITWAQDHLGFEILVDGKMKGKDVGNTRAPQAQGITTYVELFKTTDLTVRPVSLLSKLGAHCCQ